jgi:hypothetical protein
MRVQVEVVIDADVDEVWAQLADIGGHVSWMVDAKAITFVTPRHQGRGTTFDCETVIGPIRLLDRMEVTEWDEGRALAIRHLRPVRGTGYIGLEPAGRGATRVTWAEDLRLPWWLGGPAGAAAARPILERLWGRSLTNLKRIVEGAPPNRCA